MADVTATFAAKDQGVAAMIQRLENKLTGFQTRMSSVSASAKRMQGSFANLGRSVVGLAGAYIGVSAAINSFNKALDMSGRLNELSQSTGETAGNLAVLERAFENAGVGGDRVGPMIAKMSNFIGELAKGSNSAAAVANKLGISLSDLRGKTPIQQMQILLRAIAGVADETTRMDLSGEVFGNRMGYKLIPLANNFTSELANARGELGSLVEILDKNSASLDELGDKLKNSVGNKLTELTVGFLAGVQGANDLANALSKIDAAGAGMKLGQMFSGALKAPELAFLGIGEILLLGIKKAMNALLNAVVYAGKVYAEMFGDSRLYKLIGSNLLNVVVAAASTFGRMMLEITKTIVSTVSKIPGMQMVDPFGLVTRGITAAQDKLAQTSKEAADALFSSMKTGSELMSEAATRVQRESVDYFGAAAQRGEVSAVADRLRGLGTQGLTATNLQDSSEMQRLRDQFNNLRDSMPDSPERRARENELINAMKDLRDGITRVVPQGVVSPASQMQTSAMPQATREELARSVNPASAQNTSVEEIATETTLQKVAKFLEELNTKLPQPVLV